MTKIKNILNSAIFALLIIMEVILMGCTSFKQYKQDAKNMCTQAAVSGLSNHGSDQEEGRIYPKEGEIITRDHLNGLPKIVQQYLTESGVIGHKMVSTAQLLQTGRIRTKPDAAWMKVNAVETFNIELNLV